MENKDIENLFCEQEPSIAGNRQLRLPQIEGWQRAREHFLDSSEHAILQLPVGCGKTGLMALLPFGIARGRVLVITPNVETRRGATRVFDASSPKCFVKAKGIRTDLHNGPFAAALEGGDTANIHDCNDSHIVVTNIQQLVSYGSDNWLDKFSPDYFDMILVDEGHHNVAESWNRVFQRFPNAKVCSLTATPFRGDGRPLAGKIIYKFPIANAMHLGYISQIRAVNVETRELYFTYKGDPRHYTREEVMELREENWFSKGVALAPECNKSIVAASFKAMQQLRRSGTHHQIIAVACSVDHARQIRSLYSEIGCETREIHNQQSEDEKEDALNELRTGKLDCIVQVRMLGEGFDHPNLSVAAIFQPFRTLSPYVQFVGRIMRVVHDGQPDHADNRGIVVSHIGLNVDRHWTEFRQLDGEDQEVISEWLEAGDHPSSDDSSKSRRRFEQNMTVQREVLDLPSQSLYLKEMDEAVLQDLSNHMQKLGLDPEELGLSEEDIRKRISHEQPTIDLDSEAIPVNPQRHRRELRKRLNERVRSLAKRILDALGFGIHTRGICLKYPENPSENDFSLVVKLANTKVSEHMGVKPGSRGVVSAGELQKAFDQLDQIGDEVEADIRNRLK